MKHAALGVLGASDRFLSQPKDVPYYVRNNTEGPWLDCIVKEQYASEPYQLQWAKIVNNVPM